MNMQIVGNAVSILNSLNKNDKNKKNNLEKLASGLRITGAKSDASGYSVSEHMRVLVRALDQDIRNVQNGASLLKTAAGGVDSIIDELRNMKELALNSLNDTNNDADRELLDKILQQKIANINDMVTDTSYNGKILLDGSWKRASVIRSEAGIVEKTVDSKTEKSNVSTENLPSTTNTTTVTLPPKVTVEKTTVMKDTNPGESSEITTETNTSTETTTDRETSTAYLSSNVVSSDRSESKNGNRRTVTISEKIESTKATTTTDIVKEITTTETITTEIVTSVKEIEGTEPIIIHNGTTSISADGVYEFAPNYTGTLTVSAQNAQLNGPKSGATLRNVNIVDGGVRDLYIKNLKIENYDDIDSVIAFNPNSSSKLHILGTNYIFQDSSGSYEGNAIINIGGGLDIVGNGSLKIEFDDGGLERGAVIGTDEYRDDESEVFGDIAIGRGVTLDIKCKNQNNDYSSMRAGIGSGFSNGCGNIYIGTGANITIDILGKGNTTVTDGAGIGGGMCYDEDWAKKCGDIIIYSGATVNVKANCGAAIGGSAAWGYCSDITIYSDAKVEASSKYGAGIGAGIQYSHNYNRVGNITVYSYSSGDVNASTSDEAKALSAEDIGKGYPYSPDGSTEIGDINLLDEYKKVEGGTLDWGSLENEGGFEVTTTTTTTREVAKTITETRNSVVETFDEKEDRITTTVYEDIAEKKTPHNPLVIHHGSKANIEIDIYFKDMRSSAMGLDGVKIVPKENAALALDKVDDAIEYALDEATNIGAYCNRLEFTKNNLETSNENTVAAESVIRDADMAREATEFAKYNVLAEASNAMLAQANQEFSRILSLLQ